MTTTTAGRAPAYTPGNPIFVAVALAIVYVVWGSTHLAIRIMVEEMPPLVGSASPCTWCPASR